MKSYILFLFTISLILGGYGYFAKLDHIRATVDQQDKKDYGIGPVKNLKLDPVDKDLAKKGSALFNSTCTACHGLDQKVVGPPLRNVTKDRTPEFIMNLLLNTVQMQQEDPIIKDLISTYKVPMTPPEFTNEQARSVLEYLRSVAK